MSAELGAAAPVLPRPATDPVTVELVVPVHNEQRALPGCLRALHEYLGAGFPFDWRITVVDNGSADDTAVIAAEQARVYPRLRVLRLPQAGRGHALRTAWQRSTADIVAYTDVDLSTGLSALLPLVAPLVNGHSDVAVGTRLAPGARTVRRPGREITSRCYNALLRFTHGARFSDAQCGFKAARTEVIRPLLARTRDDRWFFDTELLLLAEHNGLRIHQVPVDWIEDVDSRVRVFRTALEDLLGLIRVARAKATGTALVPDLPRRPALVPAHPDARLAPARSGLLWQVLSFLAIGGLSTLATLALYALCRTFWPPLAANLVALVLPTVFNTEANRRYTFPGGTSSYGRSQLIGLLVFAGYWALTSGALLLLPHVVHHPSRWLELGTLLVASAVATLARFLALRRFLRPSRTEGK